MHPDRRRDLKAKFGVRGLDVAKALLEEGFHAPTVYFPLIVEEALMFEPTETESVQTLEALAQAIERIAQRAETTRSLCTERPRTRRSRELTRRAPPATSSPLPTPNGERRSPELSAT